MFEPHPGNGQLFHYRMVWQHPFWVTLHYRSAPHNAVRFAHRKLTYRNLPFFWVDRQILHLDAQEKSRRKRRDFSFHSLKKDRPESRSFDLAMNYTPE
jgi:hypothetical protein